MKSKTGIRRRRWGWTVGGVLTGLGCAAASFGLFAPLNNVGIDLHFRHASSTPADPRVVLIDLDDRAISTVGNWPWPRREYARLVRTLDQLGASAIVLDLLLDEPTKPRLEQERFNKNYDIDPPITNPAPSTQNELVFDDDELASALSQAGNVYLAAYFKMAAPATLRSIPFLTALELAREHAKEEPLRAALHEAFRVQSPFVDIETLQYQGRLGLLLEQNYSLDLAELTESLRSHHGYDPELIAKHLPETKRLMARSFATRFATKIEGGDWPSFFAAVLPEAPIDERTADRTDLLEAYRTESARQVVAKLNPPTLNILKGRIPLAIEAHWPLDKLARSAKGVGLVSFERKERDGVIRSVPLLVDADGVLIPQLALLAAGDQLGLDLSATTLDGNSILLPGRDSDRRLQIDSTGSTPLNWHAADGSLLWQDSFTHIPAARVWEIDYNRSAAKRNDARLGLAFAELLKLRHEDTPSEYEGYVEIVNHLLTRKNSLRDVLDQSMRTKIESDIVELTTSKDTFEQEALFWLRRGHLLWQQEQSINDNARITRDQILRLYEDLVDGKLTASVDAANAELSARTDELTSELRGRIEGKVCIVGYTASGVADLISTPLHAATPGVMAHANIFNSLLINRPMRQATQRTNLGLFLLCGLSITWFTCRYGPIQSLIALLLMSAAVLSVGVWAFWNVDYYLATPVAIVSMSIVWAGVTAYRQLTEQRSRQQFQLALAQYTSPAVAARIAASEGSEALSPQSQRVTCFFCDLQGFTHLSETLGPDRTRAVLNPYLREISAVLIRHGAIVNKFMGDGIFAFFNAPILRCDNHASTSSACALEAHQALDQLNAQATPSQNPLKMRVGLATGDVFVGDYGSENKLDYTCIGDTVNVAARLEQVNKILGTRILVENATRKAADGQFVFRTIGLIEIAGKERAVDVHELIASKDLVEKRILEPLDAFEEAVEFYRARNWNACLDRLDQYGASRPSDRVFQHYKAAATHYQTSPPPSDWNGALHLPSTTT